MSASTPDTESGIERLRKDAAVVAPPVKAKAGGRGAAKASPAAEGRRKDGPASVFDLEDLLASCPVTPLGMQGKVYWFLDVQGQMISFDKKLDEGELTKLFGAKIGWLDKKFPSYNKDGEVVSGKFDQRLAQRFLIIACQDADIFDATDCERGRGCHVAEDGSLILHLGLKLIVAGSRRGDGSLIEPFELEPGRVGDLIFPRATAMYQRGSPPLVRSAATTAELWALLSDHWDKWQWKGQRRVPLYGPGSWEEEGVNIQAWLVLGWAMMATVCGAMPQRPTLFLSGPSGGGKSSLHDSLYDFIGRKWATKGKNVTAASLGQEMGKDRLALLVDEKGGESQNQELLKRILELVKISYDGDKIKRGGANGQFTSTELFSACQLGGVFPPSEFKAEDRNRMVMVEIDKFPIGSKPYVKPKIYAELGPKARRRMVDEWHRFDAVLQAYRAAMMVRNFEAREANTYATVLACADIALYDDSPDPTSERIAALIHCITPMLSESRAEGEDPPEIAIAQMFSVRVSAAHGKMQETIGQWIDKTIVSMVTDPYESGKKDDAKLQSHGLRIVTLGADHEEGSGQGLGGRNEVHQSNWRQTWLVVGGKTHGGVAELFKGSDFSNGRWVTAFQRLKHMVCDDQGEEIGLIESLRNKRVRIGGGNPGPCVMVPIAAVTDLEELAVKINAAVPVADF